MLSLEVLDPRGAAMDANKFPYAARLPDLNGKTIGEISNRLWASDRIFPVLREELTRRFPDIRIIPYTEFPSGADQLVDNEELGEIVLGRKVDAVIGASAA